MVLVVVSYDSIGTSGVVDPGKPTFEPGILLNFEHAHLSAVVGAIVLEERRGADILEKHPYGREAVVRS